MGREQKVGFGDPRDPRRSLQEVDADKIHQLGAYDQREGSVAGKQGMSSPEAILEGENLLNGRL